MTIRRVSFLEMQLHQGHSKRIRLFERLGSAAGIKIFQTPAFVQLLLAKNLPFVGHCGSVQI